MASRMRGRDAARTAGPERTRSRVAIVADDRAGTSAQLDLLVVGGPTETGSPSRWPNSSTASARGSWLGRRPPRSTPGCDRRLGYRLSRCGNRSEGAVGAGQRDRPTHELFRPRQSSGAGAGRDRAGLGLGPSPRSSCRSRRPGPLSPSRPEPCLLQARDRNSPAPLSLPKGLSEAGLSTPVTKAMWQVSPIAPTC